MYFGEINTTEAIGCYLAHSIQLSDTRLRKGLRLEQESVEQLIAEGHSTVRVARLEEGDIHEDEAARQLADVLCGTGLRAVARAQVVSTCTQLTVAFLYSRAMCFSVAMLSLKA